MRSPSYKSGAFLLNSNYGGDEIMGFLLVLAILFLLGGVFGFIAKIALVWVLLSLGLAVVSFVLHLIYK